MGKHGDNTGTAWPAGLDTICTEFDFSTFARAAVPNDISKAVVAIENSLGIQSVWSGAYSTFSDAITAANSSGKTLIISTSVDLPAGNPVSITSPIFFLGSGKINKGSASSLTISGPIVGNPMHQLFVGFAAGEVVFGSNTCTYYSPEWFNNDLAVFISAVPNTGKIILKGTYNHIGNLTINKSLSIYGYNATLSFPTNSANQGIIITSSDVEIFGLSIAGPQYATMNSTQIGINIYGTVSSYLSHIKIENCYITDFGYSGIETSFIKESTITGNTIKRTYYAGIQGRSTNDTIINENIVSNILADGVVGSNAYGIAITKSNGTESVYPTSRRVTISNNLIQDIRTWEGLDTHGGQDIIFSNNVITDCHFGISIGEYNDGTTKIPPRRCKCDNNVIYNNHGTGEIVTFANSQYGIPITGVINSGTLLAEGNSVSNNVITGFMTGIYSRNTLNNIYSNNTISYTYNGVYLIGEDVNIVVANNVIENIIASSTSAGIWARRNDGTTYPTASSGLICNNVIKSMAYSGILGSEYLNINFKDNFITTNAGVPKYKHSVNLSYFQGEISPFDTLSIAWDAPSIAADSNATTTAAITGLDSTSYFYATVEHDSSLLGLVLDYALSVNLITLYLYNNKSTAIDVVNTNFFIKVHKQTF